MTEEILNKIRMAGFKDVDSFVKANLYYLSESSQNIFYSLKNLESIL